MQAADLPLLIPGVLAALERHYALRPGATQQLAGGEEASVWRLDSAPCVVVHVSPLWRGATELAWVHTVIVHAAQHVPEAVAPLPTRDGRTFIAMAGRLLSVYPFIAGHFLDRTDPSARAQAAQLLARLHRALLGWLPPAPRPAGGADTPWQWDVDDDPPDVRDADLDSWWAATAHATLVSGVTHGDFWRQNLLVAGAKIVGLIDWHEAAIQPLVFELASALWEFGHDGDDITLNQHWAHAFLEAYVSANGPVPAAEFGLIPDAMRFRIRRDIRYSLKTGALIDSAARAYLQLQCARFRALKASGHHMWP